MRQVFLLAMLLLAPATWADASLTELETRWLNAADPVLTYAEKQGLPIDIVVQPQSRPGDVPLAMGFQDGRCKLVMSFRGNSDVESILKGVQPAQVDTTIEAMIAHEVAHCWRHTQGAWHSLPAGFISQGTDAGRAMEETRQEEGFADLVALAWTQDRHPERYAQVYAWLQQVRGHETTPGSHHDTRAWIDLAGKRPAFKSGGSLFDKANTLWVAGLGQAKRG